jgi:signal transduction histidine kinase/CheY-like chemotaxis protein
MSPAPARDSRWPREGRPERRGADRALQRQRDAEFISEQLPRRRRRLGLALVGLGVFALAAQSWVEWLLPYDMASLEAMRRLLHQPALGRTQLVWGWAGLCGLLLVALARAAARSVAQPMAMAVACGLVLGSAYATAGGPAAASAMLLLVGVATLGWHARGEGGLALLASTAAAVALWDFVLSDFASLWMAATVIVLMLVWIDHQHIRANDRRLFRALAERDSLITSLDQRSEQLTGLQGARTRLLASISHDLRQPLQAVRLFGEALQARQDGDPAAAARWHDLLRQQMRAADDAVAMLDQFSEISAIEQGAMQSRPELVNVRDVLDGVAASLQATHPRELLSLRVHGRAQWLHTDRTQLARLVQNLAGNAVRYSLGARPGARARVVLAVRPWRDLGDSAAQGLVIDVIDNGRGIPPDKLEAVWEPYVQLADANSGASRGGRGLGLAIVRGLAAQLDLQLAPVRSVLGRGTRFRVHVPAGLRREPPAPQAPVERSEDLARLDGWLLALLDDEPGPRAALRAALEGVGATIVDAPSLEQLKAALDDEPRFPDALVFDLDLGPGKPDGLAAVDELRREWELPVPAVIVTGRIAAMGTVPMPKRCTLLGKPVPLATLVGTLRRIVPVRATAAP